MSEFCMPSLGSDMEAGTLVEWLKTPGDHVRRGDAIAVVETQKGAIEIEIFQDGVFGAPLAEIGQTLPVGSPLARIVAEGEDSHAAAKSDAVETAVQKARKPKPAGPRETITLPAGPAAAPRAEAGADGLLRASPAARKLAAEQGFELSGIAGSGPGGAIVLADVEAASATRRKTPSGKLDLTEMAAAIGAAMSRSKREIPHYYLSHTIDLTGALDWLETRNAQRAPNQRILAGVLFVKAVALALGKRTGFNGFYADGAFQPSEAVNVGVAVSIRGGGLIAPAIHDVPALELGDLMAKMRDVVGRVRSGRLRSSELSDATVTVTSLGERGVERMYSVIYPPQVAILGFGGVVERPWAVDGEIKLRRVVEVSLAGDHRVSDGHRGAALLNEIDRLLQEPERL